MKGIVLGPFTGPLGEGVGLRELPDRAPMKKKHHMDPQAQAMELKSRWEAVNADRDPKDVPGVGDLAVEMPGLRRWPHEPILIVWCAIDRDDPEHRATIDEFIGGAPYLGAPLDVFVAYIATDSRALIILPYSTRLLLKYAPEDSLHPETGADEP